MAKINEYPQAVSINNNDLFVIDQESGGDHATKSASVSQIADKVTDGLTANDIPLTSSDPTPTATAIGDLSQLTTSVTSSLVGAVNEKATVVDLGRLDSTTKTITFSSAVRFLICSFGGSDNRLGAHIAFGRATTSFAQPLLTNSTVTVTPNNDKIAITTNTSNIYISLVILTGSVDDFVIT